ncbi:hypothetical protein [Sporomusa acidovorans]|uniref:Uncharacterized protein n=1 Tax=Sporomusa acidovorans (strain ATCC 49682 / DSM 3132 / Mol) TaxID=1123286 RepID=A0ABZ3IZL8_SPOA4|nr:hypothetical protein [Sporomusa acidovorans]OZC19179.1 hypothetical protein SPACI_32650 [Sporomusa acidovorans DSM 3132]SDF11564.1 hypothetical protein SAMN04488499_103339 [Sporomusa acidovorans]
MCDVDRLLAPLENMDRTTLAKAYLMALQENICLRRQVQKAAGQDLMAQTEVTSPTAGKEHG